MSTGYQIREQNGVYFLTLQVIEWVDVFTRAVYKDIIVENLSYCCQHKGLEIFAFVIMSNHVHLIARSNTNNLSGTLRDFKSYTSKEMIKVVESEQESRRHWMLLLFSKAASKNERNSNYQFWTQDNHAEQIWSNSFAASKIDYIHQNPVRSKIVYRAEDYMYSSARNYAGLESVLEVSILTRKWKTYG